MVRRTQHCLAVALLLGPVSAYAQLTPVRRPEQKAPPVGSATLKPALPPDARRMIPTVPPVITSVRAATGSVNMIVRAGDTIVVQGTGLDGISPTVTLNLANNTGTAAQPNWVINTFVTQTFPAPASSVTATGFKFAVPDVPSTLALLAKMVVTVTKGTASVTSKDVISVGQKPTERKITRVEQTAVRGGGRVRIHGLGFNDVLGPGGYNAVTVGYFGVGTPGSVTNPAISVSTPGPTYVELLLPRDCNQRGVLMLRAPGAPGSTETYIVATPPIIVGCGTTPSGSVVESVGAPNGVASVAAGGSVTIRGTGLRFVTRIVDQTNLAFPFTLATIGSGPGAFDQLTVSLAPAAVGRSIQFSLENSLTDPVVAGTVAGTVLVR